MKSVCMKPHSMSHYVYSIPSSLSHVFSSDGSHYRHHKLFFTLYMSQDTAIIRSHYAFHGPGRPTSTPQAHQHSPLWTNSHDNSLFWRRCSAKTVWDFFYNELSPQHAAEKASGDAGAVQINSKNSHISRVVTIANTAAMSFLAKYVYLTALSV